MKILNRNHLKLIAIISMIVDHIGFIFFPDIYIFRVIGRLAFPLFAFFIAEGMYYTKNRKKYILTMLIFAIISQIPYMFFLRRLNILFTFLFAMLIIYFNDITKRNNNVIYLIYYALTIILITTLGLFGLIDYGIIGIILVFLLYKFKGNLKYQYLVILICMALLSVLMISIKESRIYGFVQLASLLTIPLIMLYNNNKGKVDLKYLFYLFYPIHLIILLILKIILL